MVRLKAGSPISPLEHWKLSPISQHRSVFHTASSNWNKYSFESQITIHETPSSPSVFGNSLARNNSNRYIRSRYTRNLLPSKLALPVFFPIVRPRFLVLLLLRRLGLGLAAGHLRIGRFLRQRLTVEQLVCVRARA